MLCDFLYEGDNTPVNWVFPPGPQPDAPQQAYTPPAVETNSAPGYTCTGSDGVVRACDTQQVIPPSTTAYAPEATTSSSGLVVPLTSYGIGGHTINVTLGISTPATMLIDTGATVVSLPKDVADQLIGIGDAVVITQANFTIADGTTSTQNVIDIGRFTIGGRTLYRIKSRRWTCRFYDVVGNERSGSFQQVQHSFCKQSADCSVERPKLWAVPQASHSGRGATPSAQVGENKEHKDWIFPLRTDCISPNEYFDQMGP